MDKRNENISGAFGNYNNEGVEVKNVSSSMWEPISAGRSTAKQNSPQSQKKTAAKPKTDEKKQGGSKKSSSKKKTASKKSTANTLISEGNPAAKKKAEPQKKTPQKAASDKKAPKKKTPPSRTPKGRDLRKDAREQQKHREELFKFRENYNEQLKNQRNHDEISQQRNDGKRKKLALKNILTVAVVMFFAVAVIVLYCYNRGALVGNIIIEGNSVYSAEEIQQAAGITVGKNMLSLRESRVRRELTAKLPYIKDVSIEYDLPDTVIVTVKATTDKYVIVNQSGSLTLDSDRKVVAETAIEEKSGLFLAEGFDFQRFKSGDTYKPDGVNAERFAILERLVTLFEESKVVETAVIDLHNTEDVKVTVDGKVAVYFGDCKNLEEKIPYASGIIKTVRKADKTGYIDMRFDLGYFKPGSMNIG